MLPTMGGHLRRVTTWNVNGLRQALRKGMLEQVEAIAPDVLLVQEIKGGPERLAPADRAPAGWHVHWNAADKKGYSGTAVWSRSAIEVLDERWGAGPNADEGRIALVRTAGLVVGSVYLPNGDSSRERQAKKETWMQHFLPWAHEQLARFDEPLVLGGDLNIAHTPLDVQRVRSRSGFLPHERRWFDQLLAAGLVDLQRQHVGSVDGPYSWWRARQKERALHSGWRIDYLLGNERAASTVRAAHTLTEAGQGISDHAPVSVDLELSAADDGECRPAYYDRKGMQVPHPSE